jgi:AbrB family looped-hinge helix DNA binding protein
MSSKGQIAIPKELRDAVGISADERIYCVASQDDPATIVLVPAGRLTSWLAKQNGHSTRSRREKKRDPAGS